MKIPNHNKQKKVAVINDFTGFGRCSLAVSLPIISHMKIQCNSVITSVFSNHTGFEEYFFDDYTDKMQEYIDEWKKLDLEFQGIYSGFLGSRKQIQIVEKFINDFKREGTKVIVDPVMGDNGKLYATYNDAMCQEMKKLVCYADILTPNVTEACILTDTQYREKFTSKELFQMVEKLSDLGAEKIVISGVKMGEYIGNVVYEKDKIKKIIRMKRVGQERSGTGDIFASIITADCVNGVDFETSVRKAGNFIKKCNIATEKYEVPKTDGVCFEEVIDSLK
ncbi:MAG: pyridoxamine kinase [Clostridiales bacterium]|nr:pyridoxamine kinase [Clostridiales bacterium]